MIEESKRKLKKPNEYLNKMVQYLDGLDLWVLKFSTGEIGKQDEANDSLYYVMPNGASLRLKRTNLEKGRGLNNVIQPFMERLFFEERESGDPTEHLSVGDTTMEYCSDEFYELQNQDEANGEFVSQIRAFYKDGKLVFVERPNHLYHEHNGSEINHVFLSKLPNK